MSWLIGVINSSKVQLPRFAYAISQSGNRLKFGFATNSFSSSTVADAPGQNPGTGYSNLGVAGYWGSGPNGGQQTIKKMPFITETASTLSGTTQQADGPTQFASFSHGFQAGGYPAGDQIIRPVIKVDFATDTSSDTSAYPYGTGFFQSYQDNMTRRGFNAYILPGYGNIFGGSGSNTIKKYEFSNDTVSGVANAPATMTSTSAHSSSTSGYYVNNSTSVFYKYPYATETSSTINGASNFTLGNRGYSFSDADTSGYLIKGFGAGNSSNWVVRDYATDSTTVFGVSYLVAIANDLGVSFSQNA